MCNRSLFTSVNEWQHLASCRRQSMSSSHDRCPVRRVCGCNSGPRLCVSLQLPRRAIAQMFWTTATWFVTCTRYFGIICGSPRGAAETKTYSAFLSSFFFPKGRPHRSRVFEARAAAGGDVAIVRLNDDTCQRYYIGTPFAFCAGSSGTRVRLEARPDQTVHLTRDVG